MAQRYHFILYATWLFIVLVLVFMQKGIETANLTHGLVILFLILQFLLVKNLAPLPGRWSCRSRFLATGLFNAAVIEGFYMIHEPVFKVLKCVPSMSLSAMVRNYAIDLAFTLPVYLAVFSVIWYCINKYQYTLFQYLIVFSLGQALGDGGVFFFSASPFLLLFIPYTLVNYHAMNVLPFVLVRDHLPPGETGWKKLVVPPLAVILVYLAGGALIKMVGSLFTLQ